jgi:hypothetical protein
LVVHALPSLQESVLPVWAHPDAGTQLSSVQTLWSSQFFGGPPTQTLFEHLSLVVHALPSLQESVLPVWEHPVAGTQLSVVQTLWSSQYFGGRHATLFEHLSLVAGAAVVAGVRVRLVDAAC